MMVGGKRISVPTVRARAAIFDLERSEEILDSYGFLIFGVYLDFSSDGLRPIFSSGDALMKS